MIKAETQGRYLAPESVEQNRQEARERAEEKMIRRREAAARRWLHAAGLVAVSGGLIYMILGGLIDQTIGTVVLAVLSAALGRGTA